MNIFHTQDLLEIAKQRNQEEVVSQLTQKVIQRSSSNFWLAALGAWMAANGEKLQDRYGASLEISPLGFPQGKAKKARVQNVFTQYNS